MNATIGFKIKVCREEKRYSQEYVAAMLNITQASYSRIESGVTKLSLDKLKSICDLLHVKASDFIDEGESTAL